LVLLQVTEDPGNRFAGPADGETRRACRAARDRGGFNPAASARASIPLALGAAPDPRAPACCFAASPRGRRRSLLLGRRFLRYDRCRSGYLMQLIS
jgi:hypothetical protein